MPSARGCDGVDCPQSGLPSGTTLSPGLGLSLSHQEAFRAVLRFRLFGGNALE